jgi:hypothetical protein
MQRMLVIGLAALVTGCAGGGIVPSRSLSGRSGAIAWEVRDEEEYETARQRILQGL